MAKRFLFLDDNPERHRQFNMMTIGCLVDHVWTAKECIKALQTNAPYDCVFLDHDLGGLVFVKEVEGSGTEVAYFIRDQLSKDQYPQKFIVHSWNPEGAKRMVEAISQTGVSVAAIPFKFITT